LLFAIGRRSHIRFDSLCHRVSCRRSPSIGIRFSVLDWMKLPISGWVGDGAPPPGMAPRLPVSQCEDFLRKHLQSAKWISSPLPHIRLPRIAPNNEHKTMLRLASQFSSAEPASSNFSSTRKNWSGTSVLGVSRSLRSQHVLLHFPSESYQEFMFDLPTEDDAALRRAVIISWDALATHLSICGRSDQVPGVIMAKQRSTACIPACVDTMDVFFLPHAFGIVPWLVLPHGTVATRGRGVFQAHPSPRNQPRSYHLRLKRFGPQALHIQTLVL
jgi:hypothetical protein